VADLKLIKRGAEAELYRGEWLGFDAIFKRRVRKAYRNADLDRLIRSTRTSLEAKLLSGAKRIGVPTPVIYSVDLHKTEIVMSYIDGTTLKKLLPDMGDAEINVIFSVVGDCVAKLHRGGIVHGDLTTSNILVINGKIFFIDFGLGEYTESLEARGVDIHLMRRALESSHYQSSRLAYQSFAEAYSKTLGDGAEEVLRRVGEIRRRGRYVDGGRCMVD
jgi:Kae1-associated kinase Bud32